MLSELRLIPILKRFWTKLKDSAAEPHGIHFNDPLQDLTPRARVAIQLAEKHAQRLRHDFVGTEHLLLGVLELGQGVACNVLRRAGIDLEGVSRKVEQLIGHGPPDQASSGPPPFTPMVKRVLEQAQQEKRALSHTYLGTEHLLLGILKEGKGVAAVVLKQHNLDLDQVRREVLKELDPNFAAQEDSGVP